MVHNLLTEQQRVAVLMATQYYVRAQHLGHIRGWWYANYKQHPNWEPIAGLLRKMQEEAYRAFQEQMDMIANGTVGSIGIAEDPHA